jgi:hypothetical protein
METGTSSSVDPLKTDSQDHNPSKDEIVVVELEEHPATQQDPTDQKKPKQKKPKKSKQQPTQSHSDHEEDNDEDFEDDDEESSDTEQGTALEQEQNIEDAEVQKIFNNFNENLKKGIKYDQWASKMKNLRQRANFLKVKPPPPPEWLQLDKG